MGSLKCQCVAYHMVPTRLTDAQGSFATTWRRRRLGLEKLELFVCGQHLLAPHLLGESGEGLGNNANVLDVKVQSSAPLSLLPLGENPSTMLASHGVCDWISILNMHSGALPSDNNAEPSVSYDGEE
jgi:hypothetical protein